jgi:hypothetical protein
VHIIESAAFFGQPGPEYRRLLSFLGLQPFEPPRFDRHNARPGAPMEARTRKMLEEHYRPHDERLARLLGRPPMWAR